jgi:hypothetical protein
MIEIVVLYFLSRQIGNIAIQKGLRPGYWKAMTYLAWIIGEIAGFIIAIALFGFDEHNLLGLISFAVLCAFGGYLFVRYTLEKKPDNPENL